MSRWLPILFLAAACVPARPEAPLELLVPGPEPAAVLEADGGVRVAGRLFRLERPDERAAFGAVAARLAGQAGPKEPPALVIAGRPGAPFAAVEALMDALAEAGVETYRLDLNRAE